MLTVKEVASELKVSLSLAYRLAASGEIPCYQIASCKRVDERDLRAYLDRQRTETKRPPRRDGRHF